MIYPLLKDDDLTVCPEAQLKNKTR